MGTKHSMECSAKPTGSDRSTKNSCPNANTGDPPSLPTFDIKGHHDATTDYDRCWAADMSLRWDQMGWALVTLMRATPCPVIPILPAAALERSNDATNDVGPTIIDENIDRVTVAQMLDANSRTERQCLVGSRHGVGIELATGRKALRLPTRSPSEQRKRR